MSNTSTNNFEVTRCGCCPHQPEAGIRRVSVDSIRVSPTNHQRVVILKDDSDRYLPIWIGPAEADSIAVKLQNLQVPKPLTHDLLQIVIEAMSGRVRHFLVSDLQDDTYSGKIVIEVNGETKEIECRPSDGIALAVRAQVPILVKQSVIDRAGIQLDKETGKPVMP